MLGAKRSEMVEAKLVAGTLLALVAWSSVAEEHQHGNREKLGTVHFATSCNEAAQKEFDRAVALLHSFQFSRAIEGFNAVRRVDETCGIADWGIALSDWGNPFAPGMKEESQLRAGRESAERGKTAGAKTERERAYQTAVGKLYSEYEVTPQRARLIAYRDAMGEVAAKYKEDHEAQIFYALAIAASEDPADKTYAGRLKAGAILENLFAEEPTHPGLAHYIIHTYDVPELAGRGLVAARRYSPEFWRDKYEAFRLIQDVKQVSLRREQMPQLPLAPAQRKKRLPIRWHDEWTQFRALLRRSFISKLRNRANIWITTCAAPVLALLIGTLLRYSESGKYDFASAFHVPTYLFLGLLVVMFLSLTNSADDIIRDRPVLQRERNLDVRLPYYIFAKMSSLSVFALIQCVLFVLIGNYVLEMRGMFWTHLALMFMTAVGSLALGLLVSSLVSDAKTAANIVPLVLIPQILMSGALIKYEDMNRNLSLVYSLTRWFHEHPTKDRSKKMESKLQVPFVCQFIPMRWSYEEMIVAQAKLNPLTSRQERAQREIDSIVGRHRQDPAEGKRLDELKEVLAVLSGLEAASADELDHYLAQVDQVLDRKRSFDSGAFKQAKGAVTAEQIYVNQKVSDLISNAEMEQSDYRRGSRPNVFFGAEKSYLGVKISVFVFNTLVLVGSTLAMLGLLFWILRRQLEVRRI